MNHHFFSTAIRKIDKTYSLADGLRRLASYSNSEFFAKKAMRLSTYGILRMTVAYEETAETIQLPRGVEQKLLELLKPDFTNNCVSSSDPGRTSRFHDRESFQSGKRIALIH